MSAAYGLFFNCSDFELPRSDCYEWEPTPQLDMVVQRLILGEERQRNHVRWCNRQAEAMQTSFKFRCLAVELLIAEANNQEVRTVLKQYKGDPRDPLLHDRLGAINDSWRCILEQSRDELNCGGNPQTALKYLSCMCAFVQGKQSRVFGENLEERTRRVVAQQQLLNKLRSRGVLFLPEITSGPKEILDTSNDDLSYGMSEEDDRPAHDDDTE
jgi:hypothetical protein